MTMNICMYIESRQGHAFRVMVSCLTKLQVATRPAQTRPPHKPLQDLDNLELRALTQSLNLKVSVRFQEDADVYQPELQLSRLRGGSRGFGGLYHGTRNVLA